MVIHMDDNGCLLPTQLAKSVRQSGFRSPCGPTQGKLFKMIKFALTVRCACENVRIKFMT